MKFPWIKTIGCIAVTALLMASCDDEDDDARTGATGSQQEQDDPDVTSGATIVRGQITQGVMRINGVWESDVYGIDLDNDDTIDFRLVGGMKVLAYDVEEGGNAVVAQGGHVTPLTKGTIVGAQSHFGTEGRDTIVFPSRSAEKIYVGLRFLHHGALHYGWVKVENEDNRIEWDKCGFHSTAGSSIKAGQDEL